MIGIIPSFYRFRLADLTKSFEFFLLRLQVTVVPLALTARVWSAALPLVSLPMLVRAWPPSWTKLPRAALFTGAFSIVFFKVIGFFFLQPPAMSTPVCKIVSIRGRWNCSKAI